jgi:drug/metabolite transporter (DMT)-like permease
MNAMKVVKTPSVLGIIALMACLALWTWFAISNSRFLQRNPQINRKDFASVMGVVSLLSILPIFLMQVNLRDLMIRSDFSIYLVSSMALGFGASWLANWLWNVCSFHCRPEVAGPLIVSETVFGLLYSFGFERRLPHGYEVLSISLFLLGVFLVITAPVRNEIS